MSIFSELNNISNISMLEDYADLCGITLQEMEAQLHQGIEALSQKYQFSLLETVQKLRYYYDGYAFCEESPEIFNPFSLISCMQNRKFEPYWFESGTPKYLINMLRKFKVVPSKIGRCYASASEFNTPTESITNIVPLLYQSGYLTIKGYDPLTQQFILDIPNHEVRIGLMQSLLTNYLSDTHLVSNVLADLVRNICNGNISLGLENLKLFFKEIPYCNNTNYEGHWQQMLYVVFSLLGAHADVEVHTAEGRVDLAMLLAGKLFLIEVKLNGTPQQALDQINEKQYSDRFRRCQLPIVKIGINFNTDHHVIMDWIIEEE